MLKTGKRWVFGMALLLIATAAHPQDNFFPYNIDAQSLRGYTGYVVAPSARTLPYKNASVALHQFVLGIAGGWPREGELGVSFDLLDITPITPFTRDTYRERAPHVNLHGKYRFVRQERHGLDMAVGQWRRSTYLAVGLPQKWGLQVEGAASMRRRSTESWEESGFGVLSYTLGVQRIYAEYEAHPGTFNAGWRALLSDAIRLDISLTRIGKAQPFFDRLFFGLTITNG